MISPDRIKEIGTVIHRLVKKPDVIAAIEKASEIARKELASDSTKLAAASSIPVSVFGPDLPSELKTCRLAIMRGNTEYHVERHPNGIQYVYSLQNNGSISIFREGKWHRTELSSASNALLSERWHVVPINDWHQPVPKEADWVVLAFHSAEPGTLVDDYGFKEC